MWLDWGGLQLDLQGEIRSSTVKLEEGLSTFDLKKAAHVGFSHVYLLDLNINCVLHLVGLLCASEFASGT